jgi:hypothetical protein
MLINSVSRKADDLLRGNLVFDPSMIQDTDEIIRSCSFGRFRLLLKNFNIDEVAMLISLNNIKLNERIYLHLSDESKIFISEYIKKHTEFSEDEIKQNLIFIDFQMMLG